MAVLSITAPDISADDLSFRVLPVVFHDVAFDARETRIGMRTDSRRLQPESRMPARVLRQFATDFIIAVAMHETRRLHLAERPETRRILRNIVRQGARLEMRRIVVVALFDKMQLQMALSIKLHAFFRVRLETLPPEVQTEAPLATVQLRSVEFILPNQLPCLAFRQKTVRMSFNRIILHVFSF